MRKKFLASVFVLFFVFLEAKEVTLLLDWFANPSHVPLFAGVNKGFFNKRGVDLKIIHMQDPVNSLAYLTTRQVDIALTYMPSFLKAKQKQKTLEFVDVLIGSPLYSFLTKEKDLSNLEISYYGDHFGKAVLAELRERGIAIKEPKILGLDAYLAFYLGKVQAVCGAYLNIEKYQLEEKGLFVKTVTFEDLDLPSYEELVFVSLKSFIEGNKELIEGFQKGLEEAISFTKNHPKEAFLCYRKETLGKSPWEEKAFFATLPLFGKSQKVDREALEVWMKKRGLLK